MFLLEEMMILNIEEIAAEIKKAIGKEKVQTADFHLVTYSRDWSPRDATEAQL